MSANAFINIRIPGRIGSESQQHVLAAKVIKLLHGAFTNLQGNHKFAIDLPKYGEPGFLDVIRVFATSAPALDALIAATLTRLQEYGVVADDQTFAIKLVPVDFAGPWVVCKRYRVASRKSFSNSPLKKNCRLETLQRAEERKLPFATLTSTSSGNSFRLYFDRVEANATPGEDSSHWAADSYGLSNTEKIAVLPAL